MRQGSLLVSGLIGAIATMALAAGPLSAIAASSGQPSPNSSPSISASAADTAALHAVGGGSVLRTSADHTHGIADWDVHVQYGGHVWDVKISQASGQVLGKKLADNGDKAAGSKSTSKAEKSGVEKKGQGDVSKKPEKPDTSKPEAPESKKATVTPAALGSIRVDKKLTAVPSAYASYVSSAMKAIGGVSVKWVKFQVSDHGGYQMNVKIRLAHGTKKVKDQFSSAGTLIRQKLSNNG